MIIGIDPGSTGAIAVLSNAGLFVSLHDIPNKKVKVGKKYRTVIDAVELSRLAKRILSTSNDVIIEKVSAMPGQGVTSVFGFGHSFGLLEGVFTYANAGIPVKLVTPQKWKKHFDLLKKDKDESRKLALALYPNLAHELRLKKYHNRAEALLLARWYFETKLKGL